MINAGYRGVHHVDYEIRCPGPDDWRDFRDVRLRALKDAPSAFGSSHERELAFGEDDWRLRLTGLAFLAYAARDAELPVGIVGGFSPRDGTIALVAMWIDPAHRGSGLGDQLVSALVDAARGQGAAEVELRVTEGNVAAAKLYERCGFQYTGEREPLESDPTLDTLIMRYSLTP
jgi:ribosomal protein S18 acetylase RimI-like enzyme